MCLDIDFIQENSVDPGEVAHVVAFHQGLNFVSHYLFTRCQIKMVEIC